MKKRNRREEERKKSVTQRCKTKKKRGEAKKSGVFLYLYMSHGLFFITDATHIKKHSLKKRREKKIYGLSYFFFFYSYETKRRKKIYIRRLNNFTLSTVFSLHACMLLLLTPIVCLVKENVIITRCFSVMSCCIIFCL